MAGEITYQGITFLVVDKFGEISYELILNNLQKDAAGAAFPNYLNYDWLFKACDNH